MDARLTRQIEEHPYPLVFATISGVSPDRGTRSLESPACIRLELIDLVR